MRHLLITLTIAILLACAAYATDQAEYSYEFAKFMVNHGKTYSKYEFARRFSIFKQNYDLIKEHNAAGKSWTMSVNQFADLTWEEFKSTHLGLKIRPRMLWLETVNLHGLVTVPDAIDWREKNAVTAVKNQQQCGSCWAFSTTGSVEGAVAIKTGKLVSLSEQQLVDCSKTQGNQGCNGGLMDFGFQYIIDNKGICSEADYAYTASDGTCQKSCTPVSQISKFVDVEANNEDALKAAVAQGPVSVAIEADQLGFQFYSGGVFDGRCGTNLDHGVLAVGYGSENGKDYWIVKNSWGATWGEQGYIKLVRKSGSGSPGQCGIAMQPSYPVAA